MKRKLIERIAPEVGLFKNRMTLWRLSFLVDIWYSRWSAAVDGGAARDLTVFGFVVELSPSLRRLPGEAWGIRVGYDDEIGWYCERKWGFANLRDKDVEIP